MGLKFRVILFGGIRPCINSCAGRHGICAALRRMNRAAKNRIVIVAVGIDRTGEQQRVVTDGANLNGICGIARDSAAVVVRDGDQRADLNRRLIAIEIRLESISESIINDGRDLFVDIAVFIRHFRTVGKPGHLLSELCQVAIVIIRKINRCIARGKGIQKPRIGIIIGFAETENRLF